MKESDLQRTVCEYLTRKKHFFWRQNNTPIFDPIQRRFRKMSKYTMKGIPDIVVLTDGGYAVFLELKAKTGRLSPEQKEFQARCEAIGCEYYVVRKLEDVILVGL